MYIYEVNFIIYIFIFIYIHMNLLKLKIEYNNKSCRVVSATI